MSTPSMAQTRSAFLGAIRENVEGAKHDVVNAQRKVARIISEAQPENGLREALTKAERDLETLTGLLDRVATEHLSGKEGS